MKRILAGLIVLVFQLGLSAQTFPPIHCDDAESVCDSVFTQDTIKVQIDSTADEISSFSCLPHGELLGSWYTFGVSDTGYLRFIISPLDTLNDFDWALYKTDWL